MNTAEVKKEITKMSRGNNKKNMKNNKQYKWEVSHRGITTYHKLWVKAHKRAIHECISIDSIYRISGR